MTNLKENPVDKYDAIGSILQGVGSERKETERVYDLEQLPEGEVLLYTQNQNGYDSHCFLKPVENTQIPVEVGDYIEKTVSRTNRITSVRKLKLNSWEKASLASLLQPWKKIVFSTSPHISRIGFSLLNKF